MQHKRISVLIVFLSVVVGILSGCSASEEVKESYPENMGFELVCESPRTWSDDPYYAYYRCRITDVMYVWVDSGVHGSVETGYTSGGFSAMLDPNTGGPLTYDTWRSKTDSQENMGFDLICEMPHMWYDDPYYSYYRCRLTNVVYIWVQSGIRGSIDEKYTSGGFTAMSDPDTGGPLLYETWLIKAGKKPLNP